MEKKKIFISYDYSNDKHYKNLLLAWDKNKDFDFGFYDQSVDVSVDSTDAVVIRRVISARINDSTYFLCLVGKKTHLSKWVDWEIRKAIELKKKIIAVKIEQDNISPSAILGIGTSWAKSFTFEAIKNALASV
jgi:hypothetical protein